MPPIWSYQPFKALITALVVTVSPLYFAVLAVYYIPKRLRPHPNWTLHTSLGRAFYYLVFRYITIVRIAPDYARQTKTLGNRFVLAPTASSEVYTGVLQHKTIKPVPWGGIWFPKAPTQEEIKTRTFVLHFPGGAFVMASPPSENGKFPSGVFEAKMNAMTFFAQYRVATQFPAALQDAVTFYAYLLDIGIPAQNIVISGDSAGGNVVLALVRYIEQNAHVLPRPRGAIAWSPWVNVTSTAISTCKLSQKRATDTVPYQILQWGLESYVPSLSKTSSAAQAYISPAQHPFATRIPLLVQAGSAEILCDDIRAFAGEMEGREGNRVRYWETPFAPHDLILCGNLLGMVRETGDVVELAKAFFEG